MKVIEVVACRPSVQETCQPLFGFGISQDQGEYADKLLILNTAMKNVPESEKQVLMVLLYEHLKW
jgi:hypothetical protein